MMTLADQIFVAHMLKLLARKQGWTASGHKLEAMESRLQAEADAAKPDLGHDAWKQIGGD